MIKLKIPNFTKQFIYNKYFYYKNIYHRFILQFLIKIRKRCFLNYSALPIEFLDELPYLKTFEIATSSQSCTPIIDLVNQNCIEVQIPPVSLYCLNNACVSIKSSNFVIDNKVVIERIPNIDIGYCNYATGSVLYHENNNALVKKCKFSSSSINNGIFLGGNGSWNYYHWLIEILPKILYILRHDLLKITNNIIVSEELKKIASFNSTLIAALSGASYNLVYLNPENYYKVDTLYLISSVNNTLISSKKTLASPLYNYFRNNALVYVKELVFEMIKKYDPIRLRHLLLKFTNSSNKVFIFLTRKSGSARAYNQDEVAKLIEKKYGFIGLYLEDYTIEEQAYIFSIADFIIGPSGAAWANIIFCKKNILALSWLPEFLKDFSVFSTLAFLNDIKLHCIKCRAPGVSIKHSEYYVSVTELEKEIDNILKFKSSK